MSDEVANTDFTINTAEAIQIFEFTLDRDLHMTATFKDVSIITKGVSAGEHDNAKHWVSQIDS